MSLMRTRKRAWARLRVLVFARDGYRCQLVLSPKCTGKAEQLDHIVPQELGGTDDPENLQAACAP